jgi:hypothetical protein
MPFCPQCGKPTDSGQDFCRSCGAPLPGSGPVTSPSSYSPPVNSPADSHLSSPQLPAQSPVRLKIATLSPVLVLGFIGIILIIAAGAFFALSGSPLTAGIKNSTGGSQGSGFLPVIGQCPANLSKCSGKCVDLQTDQENCGGCGFSVPYGETCVKGQFSGSLVQKKSGSSTAGTLPVTTTGTQGSCLSGQSSCSGTCRDLSSDAKNCGSCGTICPYGQICQNGRCSLPGTSAPVVSTSAPVTLVSDITCSGRETLCGNSCVNVFTDKKNCGVCGRSCGSGEACVDARCGPACTKSGTSLCGDTCVDLDTDMNNCGACGMGCKTFLPNAVGSLCGKGECVISQCKTDYADCDEKISNGCEISLRTDASNCGSCGEKCPSGQVCYNKKCSVPIGT